MPLRAYAADLRKNLEHGDATEHTHRPALKALLEALGEQTQAINEPGAIHCGAPDFLVRVNHVPAGHVECKDIGLDLKTVAKSDQLKRYLRALPNLILTDYLEFHWYVEGSRRESAILGHVEDGKLHTTQAGQQAVEALLRQFLAQVLPTIGTPKQLAEMLAAQASLVKDAILQAFERETDHGPLHGYLADFRRQLLPDLKPEDFADMYAQTLAYGLFSAWANRPTGQEFTRDSAYRYLPATNPFLKQVLHSMIGPGLPEQVSWSVDRVVDILNHTARDSVMEGFGDGQALEDPVIHFYETFLAAYDPKLRERRGVYYTPEPVVSYIVRSVDHILKTRFGLPDGLADTATIQVEETDPDTGEKRTVPYPKVLILDPACGTGTFLHYVIRHIHRHQVEKGEQGAWADYVREHLLPRLYGFELLMAPYTMAHMKLAHCLQEETGYAFQGDERINVFMTNALEAREAGTGAYSGISHFIHEEALAAESVKTEKPIMVVIGNPPYSNFGQQNRGEWIQNLIADYKVGLNERKLNLDDDYIKFIRLAQYRIERTGYGVVAFITNNSYLDGLTHRQMRYSLLSAFTQHSFLDLHGSSRRRDRIETGATDANVFDIQQGVSIALLVSAPGGSARTAYLGITGTRAEKEAWLSEHSVDDTPWVSVQPEAPIYCFVPTERPDVEEWPSYRGIQEVFPVHGSGMTSERDRVAVHFTPDEIRRAVDDFSESSDDDLRDRYGLGSDSRDWTLAGARADITRSRELDLVRPMLYRPFDWRFTWYTGKSRGFVGTPCQPLMWHMLSHNIGLVAPRQTKDQFGVLTTRFIAGHKSVAAYDRNSLFPLYRYPGEGSMETERRPNLAQGFIDEFSRKLRLEFIPDGHGDLSATFGPEDVFDYAYAILHSPTYRERYAEFLKIDFPRLPLTSNLDLFRALVALGGELVGYHLLEGVQADPALARFEIAGTNEVEKVRYDEANQRVYINKAQHFGPVPQEVFGFHIGGYQVLDKWLKDRKGRKLTSDDVTHYRKTAVALRETIRLMGEIDAAIPSWPVE